MEFKPSFFEEEIRDGYYISGVMKRYWAAQMEILMDVAKVCEKYNIKWFADYGSLLGAARHGGFIPWDDDLDISMLRDDYMKFLEVAPKELPSNYRLHNFKISEYYENTTRVVNTDGIVFHPDFTSKYHEIPYSVGIDIFFMDYISRDKEAEKKREQVYSQVASAAVSCDFALPLSKDVEDILSLIEKICNKKIDRQGNIKKQLYYIAEIYATEFAEKEADQVAVLNHYVDTGSHIYPKDYFENPIKLKFENITINVPRYYTGKLAKDYGNYYLPTRAGGLHGYPLYENNEQATYKYLGAEDFFRYKPTPDMINSSLPVNVTAGKVLILIRHIEDFEYVKGFVLSYSETGQVYVMAMPYYYRDFTGRFLEPNLDNLSQYQDKICLNENIHIAEYVSYNLQAEHPDAIITTNAYDGYNQVYSVNPELYTDKLKACTDHLIYVQPFVTEAMASPDEKTLKMMAYYVNIPAITNCQNFVIWSEDNKTAYINFLVEIYGEEKRKIFEKKIIVCQKDKKTVNKEKSGKLFYYLNLAECIYHSEKTIAKLKANIAIFKGNSSIRPAIYLDDNLKRELASHKPEVLSEIEEILRNNSEYIDVCCEEPYKLADEADAYYGDASPYLVPFYIDKKPVMIANIDIMTNDNL